LAGSGGAGATLALAAAWWAPNRGAQLGVAALAVSLRRLGGAAGAGGAGGAAGGAAGGSSGGARGQPGAWRTCCVPLAAGGAGAASGWPERMDGAEGLGALHAVTLCWHPTGAPSRKPRARTASPGRAPQGQGKPGATRLGAGIAPCGLQQCT